MNQEQALKAAQELFPDRSDYIAVSRERKIGYKHGNPNNYYIWDHTDHRESNILGSSSNSWEEALDEARIKREYPAQADEPFEDEYEQVTGG